MECDGDSFVLYVELKFGVNICYVGIDFFEGDMLVLAGVWVNLDMIVLVVGVG